MGDLSGPPCPGPVVCPYDAGVPRRAEGAHVAPRRLPGGDGIGSGAGPLGARKGANAQRGMGERPRVTGAAADGEVGVKDAGASGASAARTSARSDLNGA